MGRGEVIPGAAPGKDLFEGDVGVVRDRAVRVARLVVAGEVAVDRLLIGDPVGADHPRVAHVDDVGIGDVEGDPAGDEQDGHDRQQGDRQRGAQTDAAAPAKAEPERTSGQVEQRRIGEGDGSADVPPVEEVVREAEAGNDHEQIQMGEPERAAPVEQPEDEDRAERQPDVGRVDHPAEGAGVAARHSPGHLVAGPRFDDLAGVRVDHDLDDLIVAREEPHLPEARRRVAAGGRREVRMLLGRGDRLRIEPGDLGRLALADPRLLLGAGRRREQQDEEER